MIAEIKAMKDGERLLLCEPCDCGSHIRHNSGGNYHDVVVIAKEGGEYYRKDESTCESSAPAEWFAATLEELIASLKGLAE